MYMTVLQMSQIFTMIFPYILPRLLVVVFKKFNCRVKSILIHRLKIFRIQFIQITDKSNKQY